MSIVELDPSVDEAVKVCEAVSCEASTVVELGDSQIDVELTSEALFGSAKVDVANSIVLDAGKSLIGELNELVGTLVRPD